MNQELCCWEVFEEISEKEGANTALRRWDELLKQHPEKDFTLLEGRDLMIALETQRTDILPGRWKNKEIARDNAYILIRQEAREAVVALAV